LCFSAPRGAIGTVHQVVKIFGKALDSRGVIRILGRSFFLSTHRSEGEEKEVIMTSQRIAYPVYDVSVRDIPEG
jgi:hypothetical protein